MNSNNCNIVVFQENGSGESKIYGIREYGGDEFNLITVSIDDVLPPIIDDGMDYLPESIDGDLVLDFLKHPDLSQDLAMLCERLNVPLVASGKKIKSANSVTPPT